jgi:hypothetical protein
LLYSEICRKAFDFKGFAPSKVKALFLSKKECFYGGEGALQSKSTDLNTVEYQRGASSHRLAIQPQIRITQRVIMPFFRQQMLLRIAASFSCVFAGSA